MAEIVFDGSDAFLAQLKTLLGRPPGNGAAHELTGIRHRLSDIVDGPDSDLGLSAKAVRLLANAAGAQEEWRDLYREAEILRFACDQLRTPTPPNLTRQCLRLIGNCVVDHDVNRQLVTGYMESLIGHLSGELTLTTVGALMNLCNDFDPAQARAAELRLDGILAEYLATDRISSPDYIGHATEMITWTIGKLSPAQLQDDTSVTLFKQILDIVRPREHERKDDIDDYIVILAQFARASEEFLLKITTPEFLEKLIDLTAAYQSMLKPEEHDNVTRTLLDLDPSAAGDFHVMLMAGLIALLSKISFTPTFANKVDFSGPIVERIIENLLLAPASPSKVCACIMLGNIAMSDGACIYMVKTMGLHRIIHGILMSGKEAALLYSAAGLMRHLSFPSANRADLAEAGLIDTCMRLLDYDHPAVRGEVAAILEKLVTNNFENTRRIASEIIPEDMIPVFQKSGSSVAEYHTMLSYAVAQALAPSSALSSTSMKNAAVEIGRMIVAMIKCVKKTKSNVHSLPRRIGETAFIARPLAQLVRQRFFPEARSEALLGLGLLATLPGGALSIVEELKADSHFLDALEECAEPQNEARAEQDDVSSGTAAGHQKAGLVNNVFVLLRTLVANEAGEMDAPLRVSVDALLSDLEERVSPNGAHQIEGVEA